MIRSYILHHGYPIVSITAHIDYNGKLNDDEMAYQVEPWIDREIKMMIPYVYLKKEYHRYVLCYRGKGTLII